MDREENDRTQSGNDGRGWVKTYRKYDEWEWYHDSHMVHLFIHLLIKANYEKNRWQGINVERGQLITSVSHLSANTGISTRSIRTCLNRLKSTNEITIKTTNRFTIITVVKYDTYQSQESMSDKQNDKQVDKQTTNKRQTNDNREEVKNIRSIYMPLFEEFWKAYPKRDGKKVGKKECCDYFIQSFTNGDRQLVIQACINYANSKTAKDGFAKDPIRFLKKDFWKDWLEAPKKRNEGEWL